MVNNVESGDEVVFGGRKATTKVNPSTSKDQTLVEPLQRAEVILPQESSEIPPTPRNFSTARSKKGSREEPQHPRQEAEDLALDDYLANLANSENDDDILGAENAFFALHDLGGSDDIGGVSSQSDTSEVLGLATTNDHLQAFGLSKISDAEATAPNILGRRVRKKNVQYLIREANSLAQDAKWLTKNEAMKSDDHRSAIDQFEIARMRQYIEHDPDLEYGSPDEKEMEVDLREALEDCAADDAEIEYQLSKMDDEHVAKLIAKQQELGIDSDALVLFDDGGMGRPRRQGTKSDRNHPRATRSDRNGKNKGKVQYWSETTIFPELIDDGIDMMPTSTARSRRAREAEIDFGISDPELIDNMRSARANDRSKKKAKKKEREELRSQGLLGRQGVNDVDLKVKYANGMRLEDIQLEIRIFMDGPKQSISFPNMDPQARKTVHGICHKLGLKSKSMGSGPARFPILYKTSRTRAFNEVAFGQIRRKYYGAPGKPGKSLGTIERIRMGRNVGGNGHYLDGDIVGASAPELGEENKGRAMLEKMGWSKGTNLGALQNPGIAEPVAQVVKRSRAGLG